MSRSQQLEENMRGTPRRVAAGNDRLISATMSAGGSAPNTPTSPASPSATRSQRRERGFWQGPFSPGAGRQSTPKRLSHGYAANTAASGGRRGDTLDDLANIDWNEVDMVTAIRRMLRLGNQSTATGFVCNLLSAISDDLGAPETLREVKKFSHFERIRNNRLIPPPEGWEAVREAVVKRHGSSRAAFTNMCSGRRGGVMSSEELHRGFIALDLPHVTDKVLAALCPDQSVKAEDIFIDFDEFMWILRGCDEGPLDLSQTDNYEEKRYLSMERDRAEKAEYITRLERRIEQLEEGGASHAVSSPLGGVASMASITSVTHHEAVVTKKKQPLLVSVFDVDTAQEDSIRPRSPATPSYRKSPSFRKSSMSPSQKYRTTSPMQTRTVPPPQRYGTPPSSRSVGARPQPMTPTRRSVGMSGAGSMRFATPPKSVPPSARPVSPPNARPPSVRTVSPPKGTPPSTIPAVSTRAVSPPKSNPPERSRRAVTPPKSMPASEAIQYPTKVMPTSPTSFRAPPSPGMVPMRRERSFGNASAPAPGSFRNSPARVSSSIKSPVRRGNVTRVPGMVTPPRSVPSGSFRAQDTAGQETPLELFAPAGTTFKRPPVVGRNSSMNSSHMADATSKGPIPPPPANQARSVNEAGVSKKVQEPPTEKEEKESEGGEKMKREPSGTPVLDTRNIDIDKVDAKTEGTDATVSEGGRAAAAADTA